MIDSTSPRAQTGGTRAVAGGGQNPGVWSGTYKATNTIQYVTIDTTGNAIDFGDLTWEAQLPYACSDRTRGLFAAGYDHPTLVNTINYVTISSTGNGTDFGDLPYIRQNGAGTGNSTRGIFAV